MEDPYPGRTRLLPSGEAPLEDGLEGAPVGVRVTDCLLELHGGPTTGSLDRCHLVVEEGPFRQAPPDLGVASTCRPSERTGHGGAGTSQRQANQLPLVSVEGVP